MKKSILFLAFISLWGIFNSNAQYWIYGGYTHTGGTGTLGTYSADDIIFGTNSTQQMFLKASNGYFGIGASFTPLHMLDVDGGDININNSGTYGYMIGGYPELYNYGQGDDVFVGYLAGNIALGYNNNNQQYNTMVGYAAGTSLNWGQENTLIGAYAGTTLNGTSMSGSYAYWNTMVGIDAGKYSYQGFSNNFYGKASGYNCQNGDKNCMYGSHAGFGVGGFYSADLNCFFGNWSAYSISGTGTAQANVIIGDSAGFYTGASSTPSNHNVFVGGFSGYHNPGGNYNTLLGYGTDAYGLSGTTQTITNAAAIGGDAIVRYDNEFILGNNAQSVGIGMVGEGFPLGKLEVFQHSGITNTIGEYVINTDPNSVISISGTPDPVIGLKSFMPGSKSYYNVSGWFQADPYALISIKKPNIQQYAIFVPGLWESGWVGITTSPLIPQTQTLGCVDIGFPFNMDVPDYALDVDGNVRVLSLTYASDSTLKKNQAAFKYGLKALRNFNPITYKYNGIGGFDTNSTYIGMTAQNLKRNVPGGVVYSQIIKDTITAGDTATIGNIYEEAVLYTAVNAIKQLDSTVTANHSGSFGACGTTLPALTSDEGINMNNNNIVFAGNSSTTLNQNQVLIGYACGATAPAKLNVLQNSGASSSTGLYVENDDPGCTVIGVKSLVKTNVGGTGETKIAGWFEADTALNCCASANNEQYAIYVPGGGGTVALGYPAATFPCSLGTHYQLEVHGSAFLSAGTTWSTSDSTIKTNVQPIINPLATISKLNGISFNYKPQAISDGGSTGTRYGFIAQQVARVIPSVVKTGPEGLEGVSYTELIPWTVEAIKQEKQTNDSLRNTVDSLRQAFADIQHCLNQLCAHGQSHNHGNGGNGGNNDSNTTIANIQEVTLSSMSDSPLLYQNIPNPFSGNTKINYYLPEGTQGATMVFYDNYGNQIKQVQLSQTGNGTLSINPENLTAGIYSYSLVVSGKTIDTKRMILQK